MAFDSRFVPPVWRYVSVFGKFVGANLFFAISFAGSDCALDPLSANIAFIALVKSSVLWDPNPTRQNLSSLETTPAGNNHLCSTAKSACVCSVLVLCLVCGFGAWWRSVVRCVDENLQFPSIGRAGEMFTAVSVCDVTDDVLVFVFS